MKKLIVILSLLLPFSLASFSVPTLIAKAKGTDIECLAKNVYHEARGEDLKGQIAVAAVTVNRLQHDAFPGSVCKVVYQDNQFSWVKQLKSHVARDKEAYDRAKMVAINYLYGKYKDPTYGAVYYHNKTVRPKWSQHFTMTTSIGSHIFYS